MSSFHPNAAGVLQHPAAAAAAAAACMHPAFMNMFNRPETIPKPSLVNNQRSNYYNANQHQSSRNREISTSSSSSSASSHCPDIASGLSRTFLPPITILTNISFFSSQNFIQI